jgi:molybdenum cofactor biosynthesis enzyme
MENESHEDFIERHLKIIKNKISKLNTMYDPRTNDIGYDPVKETKDKIASLGHPFVIEGVWVTFALPNNKTLRITFKQATRQKDVNLKALIEAAINQDEIKAGLKLPTQERESDI